MDFNVYNILLTPSKMLYKQAMIVMMSAITNCKMKCHFYIMQSDWEDEQKKICKEFISAYPGNEIDIIDVDNKKYEFLTSWKGFHNTYYKIAAHLFLPDDVCRVLYLDCDTIITKDIGKYYTMAFNDCHMIASAERTSLAHFLTETKNGYEKHGCFNGGVILFNLEKFRQDNITFDTYFKVVSEFKDSYFADQGLLSYMFKDSMILLPSYKYNHLVFQEGGEDKKFSFRYAFSLSNEEKKNILTQPYWDEEYDPEEDGTIVHFTGAYDPLLSFPIKKDKKITFPYSPNILAFNVEKKYVEPYWIMWWNMAGKLPLEVYQDIVQEAFLYFEQCKKRELTWITNVERFFEEVSYGIFNANCFAGFIEEIKKHNKKVAVIKNEVICGKFLTNILNSEGIEIVFSTSKGMMKELTDSELKSCDAADIVINCDIHNSNVDEYRGYRSVKIQDILKDTSYAEYAVNHISEYAVKKITNSVNALNETLSERIQKMSDQMAGQYEAYQADIKRLNEKNNDHVTAEAELKCTIGTLENKNNALLTQNENLSSNLAETSVNLASANKRTKELEIECDELRQVISEMENSRSWRYTKFLRKKKKE